MNLNECHFTFICEQNSSTENLWCVSFGKEWVDLATKGGSIQKLSCTSKRIQGARVSSSSHKCRVFYLKSASTWCLHCTRHLLECKHLYVNWASGQVLGTQTNDTFQALKGLQLTWSRGGDLGDFLTHPLDLHRGGNCGQDSLTCQWWYSKLAVEQRPLPGPSNSHSVLYQPLRSITQKHSVALGHTRIIHKVSWKYQHTWLMGKQALPRLDI